VKEDAFPVWVAVGLWLCCAVVLGAMAATGALEQSVNAVLGGGLLLWTAGISAMLARDRRRAQRERRVQLRAIERLVAALREQ
jgi:hypothetical protein